MRFGIHDWLFATAILSAHAGLVRAAYPDIEQAFGVTDLGFAVFLVSLIAATLYRQFGQRDAGAPLICYVDRLWWRGLLGTLLVLDADLILAAVGLATPLSLGIARHYVVGAAAWIGWQERLIRVCRFGICRRYRYWPWEQLHTVLYRHNGTDYLILDPDYSQLAVLLWLPVPTSEILSKLRQCRAYAILHAEPSEERPLGKAKTGSEPPMNADQRR